MTSILHALRTAAVSGAVLLYATSAAPQSAATAQDHDHKAAAGEAAKATKATLTTPERIAALDRRIQMLSADMRMFSGEMKVEVMASLISTMLERQALVESEMKNMRESMMQRMTRRSEAPVAAAEAEPGSLCAAN
ncbi:MAG: hypothetical protein HOP16_21380 [Acidobacteria bacterium]|nr:hypothetical protein [Acidobacteriota bacterium]